MRLVQVAKALGMTGQQLRKELETVDFGVKPTDREIDDSLAQGVVRYFAREKGIEVDMESLFGSVLDDHQGDEKREREEPEQEQEVEEQDKKVESKNATAGTKAEVNVLRKLTLEDVSDEAIKKQQKAMGSGTKQKKKTSQKTDSPKKQEGTKHQQQIKKKEGIVVLPDQITVKEFAEKSGIQVPKVVAALMSNGVMATITQNIDYDTAAIIAGELGVEVQKGESLADAEAILSRNLEDLLKDEPENLSSRPPVVAVMGHVDHGKTSILDAIREEDVVKGEAGGITQHIGAYQVEHDGSGVTFIDTPGHEAFTAMRARGAQAVDIVVLVVAADEGVKPTTIEAIDHAKDANVPIVIAINKMDKPAADPERVMGELAGHGLQSDSWGGKTPTVQCSAQTKKGIPELLDTLILFGQELNLKANADRAGVATVVESHLDQSLGPLATVIVNTGTIKTGDPFVCGETTGKIRAMSDVHGTKLPTIGPSGAVRIAGLSAVAQVGDILQVMPSEQKAKELVDAVRTEGAHKKKRSFADLVSRLSEGKLKQLKVILKADTQGSLDAITESLQKKTTDEVTVKVIHSAIGGVTETDVMMASASDGIVVAFHAPVPQSTQRAAEREGVKVQEYDIIYNLFEDIDGLLLGLIEPEEDEKIFGHLELKAIFMTKKQEQVVGGKVTDGVIKRLPFRIQRNGEEVGTGRITSLKKVDSDIKEAKEGTECGARTESTILLEEGDILEVYLKELKKKGA